MPTALVLSMHDLQRWSADTAERAPGGSLPYGLQLLEREFRLTWSDRQWHGIGQTPLAHAAGGVVRRAAPGLQGCLGAFHAIPLVGGADVALSVFENVGLGFARCQMLSPPRRRSLPHVMLACWLAEDCQHMSALQLRSARRSVRSISKVAVFSTNQVAILQRFLAVEPERIEVIPFGVDTEYYDDALVPGAAGGGGLVAIGGDSRRDYATLAAAARIADVPMTLVCYPRNIRGLELPPCITVVSGVYKQEYRRLLKSADLVVTPTVAPAYPSGQSVVLEAMSMGRPTLTTDSAAMRDYVTDGRNGMLVPAYEPEAMATLIKFLLADADRRQSLGEAAARTVRESFGLEHMWRSVAKLMKSVMAERAGIPRADWA
jgi:hypothetical protein